MSVITPMLFFFWLQEIDGLRRKLTSKLGANSPALVPDWQVQICHNYLARMRRACFPTISFELCSDIVWKQFLLMLKSVPRYVVADW